MYEEYIFMIATITSIALKSPFNYFVLSFRAWKIMKQLKTANHIDFRKRGVWTKHYTMTLWQSENEMKKFAKSGDHKEATHNSRRIAKEIRTITIDAKELPSWPIAKQLLAKGKVITFK